MPRRAERPRPSRLERVLDFGVSPERLAELAARRPPTVKQIAALIVDETDLARRGRWAGAPQPRRRRPGR